MPTLGCVYIHTAEKIHMWRHLQKEEEEEEDDNTTTGELDPPNRHIF